MCGIAGTLLLGRNKLKAPNANKLVSPLKHRGPDGDGFYNSPDVSMGMRRLSIIDVSGGDQPLYTEDKEIIIFGNGEVYNYVELAKVLSKKGHKFRTRSDIEVAAHAYEEWGIEFVNRLRGMYVLAIYDKRKNTFILLRDRLGEKPCYYSFHKHGLTFSSEMKSILQDSNVNMEIDFEALDLFFHYYYVPEPLTPFKHIRKLPAGSYMVIDIKSRNSRLVKYWNGRNVEAEKDKDPSIKIKDIFADACKLTLRSDVPVGIALSGGIDSGAILSFSAPFYKDKMKAFSVGYEGQPQSDERKMAKRLADKFGVEFIDVEISTKDFVSKFPEIVWGSDDPIADIAAYSIYSVSKAARDNNVKVLLGGIGGDEIFWGYPSTIEATQKNINNLKSKNDSDYFSYQNPDPKGNHDFFWNLYGKKMKNNTLEDGYARYLGWEGIYTKETVAKNSLGLLRELWLYSNCISLNDRLSMANSVELRSPFLDYKLVECALSSEKNLESYNREPKYWFKKAMRGVLPTEVLKRKKQGFTPPVADWIRGISLNYSYLLINGALVKNGVISQVKLPSIAMMLRSANAYSLYQLLLLEIWMRLYVEGQSFRDLKPLRSYVSI